MHMRLRRDTYEIRDTPPHIFREGIHPDDDNIALGSIGEVIDDYRESSITHKKRVEIIERKKSIKIQNLD